MSRRDPGRSGGRGDGGDRRGRGGRGTHAPPALARRLLALVLAVVLPREERARLLSELDDFYAAKRAQGGGSAAWYWRQAAGMALRARAIRGGRGGGGSAGFLLDLRSAARGLARNPTLTVPAVVALGLTIGVDTAVYSVADGVLFAPLPYRDSGLLVQAWQESPDAPEGARRGASLNALLAWQSGARSLEGVGGWSVWRATLLGAGDPRDVLIGHVTPSLLHAMGVVPTAGRLLVEGDADGGPVLLLAHAAWMSTFGGDPDVVGRTVRLGAEAYEIVGIAPAGFRLPLDSELFGWAPFAPEPWENAFADFPDYGVAGWMVEGADAARVREELAPLVPPPTEARFADLRVRVAQFEELYRPDDGGVLALLAAVSIVLLLGCLNTAQLLVARGVRKAPELAVRRALGSGRTAVGRGLLLEAALLAAAGTAMGLLVALGLLRVFVAVDPGHLPGWADARVTPRVAAYLAGVAVAATLLAGWLPARLAARVAPAAALAGGRSGGRGGRQLRVQRLLLAGQAASAVVLLAGAGLLVRSWSAVQRVDPGMNADGLAAARVVLPFDRYNPGDGAAHVRFFEELTARLEERPGITGATAATALPAAPGLDFEQTFRASDGPEGEGVRISSRTVGTTYFEALAVPMEAGRGFESTDGSETERVAVLNESAARLLFGAAQDVSGRMIVEMNEDRTERYRVVGVARDVREDGLDRPPPPKVYLPWAQSRPFGRMWVAARAPAGADAALREMRAAIAAVDPELPLVDAAPVAELLDRTVAARRFNLLLLAVLGLLAMAVAVLGVAGLVASTVSAARREIGIRRALGARPASVLWSAAAPTLGAFVAGGLVGLLATVLLTGAARSLLFGVRPLDPWSLLAATGVLFGSGVIAALLPAWRAVRAEPADALSGS